MKNSMNFWAICNEEGSITYGEEEGGQCWIFTTRKEAREMRSYLTFDFPVHIEKVEIK